MIASFNDAIPVAAAVIGFSAFMVGLWRCAHGWITDGWRSQRGRSGLGLVIGGLIVVFAVDQFSPRSLRHSDPQIRLSSCKSNMREIVAALEKFQMDHYKRYPDTLAALIPTYLPAIPVCPTADKDTYSASYRYRPPTDTSPGYLWLACIGRHHLEASVYRHDRPSYNFKYGIVEDK